MYGRQIDETISHAMSQKQVEEFTFRNLFIPLTTAKVVAFIVIIAFLVYSPVFVNGFIADDYYLIVNNPLIQRISNFTHFFTNSFGFIGGSPTGIYYRPIMSLHFAILYHLFGATPFFYHFSQLGFHVVNSLLLHSFFRRFFTRPIAFVTVLIFVTHPLNVETVAYISASQDIFFVTFGLLALNVFFLKLKLRFIVVPALILICLLSKETGILFIMALLGLSFIKEKKALKNYLFGFMIVGVIYVVLRFLIAKIGFAHTPPTAIGELSLIARVENMPQIFFYYVSNFVWPQNLVMPQGWVIGEKTVANFLLPLTLDSLLVSFFLYMIIPLRKSKLLGMYVLFLGIFILGMLFHMQLFPLDMTVSDRWFYFPFIGILGMLGIFISSFNVFWRKMSIIIIVLISLALSIFTFQRVSLWRDGITLWSHDIKILKNNPEIENAYGFALIENKQYRQGQVHLEKAILLYPNASSWTNLGVALSMQGQTEKAIDAFKKGVEYGNYYLAYENLAIQLGKTKNSEALSFTNKALEKYPFSSKLWLVKSILESEAGNNKEAFRAIEKSVRYGRNQQNIEIYNLLKRTFNH